MKFDDDIGINENALREIVKIFDGYDKIEYAILYGSRAKGNFTPYSDIDIALGGNLTPREAEEIICCLDELPFAYTFDIVAYDSIKNYSLREHIDRVGVVVYERIMTDAGKARQETALQKADSE
jgi:predicted nucleotidyltransferase